MRLTIGRSVRPSGSCLPLNLKDLAVSLGDRGCSIKGTTLDDGKVHAAGDYLVEGRVAKAKYGDACHHLGRHTSLGIGEEKSFNEWLSPEIA